MLNKALCDKDKHIFLINEHLKRLFQTKRHILNFTLFLLFNS